MRRIEVIFSQALREDLLNWIETAPKEISEKPFYTLIPNVLGKGNSDPKMNDPVWPEVNEVLILYTENPKMEEYVKQGVEKIQKEFSREGIAFFVM